MENERLKPCQPTKQEMKQVMDCRFSKEIHKKLNEGSVAIAGLGGLGSNIALMLARSGVGHLHLVDFDVVELSNLNRQAYRIEHLGMYKTNALKQMIEEINPYLSVTTNQIKVTNENVKALFEQYAIVCEAFDQPEAKALLINELLLLPSKIQIVSGSGMAGFASSNMVQTKRVFKNLYMCGDGVTDVLDGIGLMAPRVSICAAHQANMVIRLLLGMEEV